jgi:IS30 family transposase
MPYHHVTFEERYAIAHLRMAGFSLRAIGQRLGRHYTTVGRELLRNGPPGAPWPYWYEDGQGRADARIHTGRSARRRRHRPVVAYVEQKLRLDWSPEQVAAKLRLVYPADPAMRVSIETLYRWVYRDARQGGTLYTHLRRRRKGRRRQTRYGAGRRFLAGRVGIETRPAVVGARSRFGDWEGDTLGRRSPIVTHVERKSRYLLAGKLADRTADTFAVGSVTLFQPLPAALRRTLTLDNGSECARFSVIAAHTGLAVYFAAPYAAWQRGTNENTNGLLRQYFPKGTDFRRVTARALQRAVDRLNHRPRKCLGYQTPHEVFAAAARGALAK